MSHGLTYLSVLSSLLFTPVLVAEFLPVATSSAPASEPVIDPKVRRILEEFTQTLRTAKTVTVDIDTNMKIKTSGMNQNLDSSSHLAIQKPNRFALRHEKGMLGVDVVADGKNLYTHMPMLSKYTIEEASGSIDEITLGNTAVMTGSAGMIFPSVLFRDNPGEEILVGATEAQYIGEEKLGDTNVRHLKIIQVAFDYELWFDTGKSPLPLKVTADMSKAMEQATEQQPQIKNMKMEVAAVFRNWKLDTDLPPDTFKIEPPKDAEKVDSLFGEIREEETSPLVGNPAPDIKLKLLDGGDLDLAAHKGKNVVVLDFWTTLCGPCVQALPGLVEITNSFKDKGVVFYAINQKEQPDIVRQFLTRKKMACTVALDEEGKASEAYQVEGIPQTVIIAKSGEVKAVHQGVRPDFKKRLRQEIEDVLAGKNIAKESEKKGETASTQPAGMELAWTLKGNWDSVAFDPQRGHIFAVSMRGPAIEVSAEGKSLREFKLEHPGTEVRIANLAGDAAGEIITFHNWGPSVDAHDAEGKLLWSYPGGMGVDDVWPADLNGDELAEVIVGYNGNVGVHVLDNTGKLLWKYTAIGNVWHVCAGLLTDAPAPYVITTSAEGKVHLFNEEGEKIKNWDSGLYATMVRYIPATEPTKTASVVVGGTKGTSAEAIALLDNQGKVKWTTELGNASPGSFDSTAICISRGLIAVGLRSGKIQILQISDGKIIGHLSGMGQRPQVAWTESKQKPSLLLVATGRALKAYRITAE